MARRTHRKRPRKVHVSTALSRKLKRGGGLSAPEVAAAKRRNRVIPPAAEILKPEPAQQDEAPAKQQPAAHAWLLRCELAEQSQRTAGALRVPFPDRPAQPPKLQQKKRRRRKRSLTTDEQAARHPFTRQLLRLKRWRVYRRRKKERANWDEEVQQVRKQREQSRRRKQRIRAAVDSLMGLPAWCLDNSRQILQSAAAVMVLATAVMLVLMSVRDWRADVQRRQLARRDFNQAFEAGALNEARAQLAELGPLPPVSDDASARLNYRAALIEAQYGKIEIARQKMRQLATSFQYLPAHVWLAYDSVNGRPLTEQTIEQSRGHLNAVVQRQPDHPTARRELARLETARGRYEAAANHLRQLSEPADADRLDLAWLHSQLGDAATARQLAGEVYHRNRAVTLRNQDAAAGLIALQAAAAIGQFDDAREIIRTLDRSADEPQVSRALAEFHLLWARDIQRHEEPDWNRAAQLLSRAVRYRDAPSSVLTSLGILAGRDDQAGQAARASLAQSLARGGGSRVHRVLGDVAYKRRQVAEAMRHYVAATADPREAVARNNLAWLLMEAESPQLEPALTLIDEAIALRPDSPQFRDTRGRIRARLGENERALSDLQTAAGALGANRELHETLALVYGRLNLPAMELHHRQQAQRLTAAQKN